MKSKIVNIFWGILLIGVGALFLVNELGIINLNYASDLFWALAFGMVSALFLTTYFLKDGKEWGLLFPTTVCAGIALIIGLNHTHVGEILGGAPVLLGIAIPFLVAYIKDPQTKQWALIPSWVMVFSILVILFERFINGNIMGALVLYSIALPFLYVYLTDKTRQWALIPFTALATVGIIPLLEVFLSGAVLNIVVVSILALPFYGVYFWSKKNWWAFIPAGVFTSIALCLLIERIFHVPFPTGIFFIGLGLTFGILWLIREKDTTEWAKFPAGGLLLIALMIFLTESRNSLVGPITLVVAGLAVLAFNFVYHSKEKADSEK